MTTPTAPAPVYRAKTFAQQAIGGAIYVDLKPDGRFHDLKWRDTPIPTGCTRLVFRYAETITAPSEVAA